MLFGDGKAAAILDTSIAQILKVKPAMKDEIGTFPFPGATAGRTQPVFLGGSDLAIAARSRHRDLAVAYLKAATSSQVQTQAITGIDGWVPVSTQLIDQTAGALPPLSRAFFTAAKTSVATPAAPHRSTYLDYRQSDDPGEPPGHPEIITTLDDVYAYDPLAAGPPVAADGTAGVLGTQAQIWTEFAPTPDHVRHLAYPRLCAFAEAAWSTGPRDHAEFRRRLGPHLELLRGLGALATPRTSWHAPGGLAERMER